MRITTKITREREDITLRLDSGEIRNVGFLKNACYHVRRDPDRHLFRKNNSYAFSYDVLMNIPEEYNVVVNEGSHMRVLVAKVGDILKHNDYKNFKSQGFELQVFYPRNLFKQELYKRFK